MRYRYIHTRTSFKNHQVDGLCTGMPVCQDIPVFMMFVPYTVYKLCYRYKYAKTLWRDCLLGGYYLTQLKSQASPHCCNPTMDCIIPSHSIRTFGASISALSKIGKDLYVEFDPVDGLILRTLNDAKSAFCEFAFDASYFDRCSSAPTKEKQKRSALTQERYTCRIPLKAMGAVVRPRKGLVSLRIRNQVSADHLYLAFEFQLQQNGSQLSVIHRIAVSDSESVTAVAPKEGCSQIVALPRLLIRMLEPLRTYEVALIINEQHKVSPFYFH